VTGLRLARRVALPPPGLVAERLRQTDMLQILALVLAALLFVLAVAWPGPGEPNETWFPLAQTRLTLLALTALGFGAAEWSRARPQLGATVAALMLFVVLSAPFDVASYAASYPAVPLWWTTLLPFVDTPAYFGVGVLLGRVAHALRVSALLPLLVPGLLVAGIALDVRLGVALVDPLTAPLTVSGAHLAVMGAIALTTLTLLLRRGRAPLASETEAAA